MRRIRRIRWLFSGLILCGAALAWSQATPGAKPSATPPAPKQTPPPAQTPTPPTPATLNIIHYSVGNGDATLILLDSTPDEKDNSKKKRVAVLIDGGSRKSAPTIVKALRDIGLSQIDLAIATHYDDEHRAGLLTIAQSFNVQNSVIYDRDRLSDLNGNAKADTASKTDASKTDASSKVGTSNQTPPIRPGIQITMGNDGLVGPQEAAKFSGDLKDKALLKCVAANGLTEGAAGWPADKPELTENAQSLAFVLTFGKFSYFIGGDLTGGGRSGWSMSPDIESLVSKDVGQVAVLRVNHHGSETSTNPRFLAALNPTVAIISVDRDAWNDRLYGWPSRAVLDRLNGFTNLTAVYLTGNVSTPKGLNDDDKKKTKVNQGTITVFTTGDGTFKVNGTAYLQSK